MRITNKPLRMNAGAILTLSAGLALAAAIANAQQIGREGTVASDECLSVAKFGRADSRTKVASCDPKAIAELTNTGRAFVQNQMGIGSALVLGSNRSIEDARKWFEKAAAQGYGPAQVNLAVLYLNGWGVTKNYGSAFYWLKAAALQGIPQAHMNLGILYLNGWGVRQDHAEALHYFRFAAERGDTGAMVDLGYMFDGGLGVEKNQVAAAEWYRRAAEGGDAMGQNNLADMYLRGEGVPQNGDLAFAWFQKAAAQGHTGARIKLGFLYMTGRGVSEDAEAAYAWILASSLAGDRRGEEYLTALKAKLDAGQLARATQRAHELQSLPRGPLTEVAFLR